MPHTANVTAPITLLGLGRSGTTLLSACFGQHPEFHSCGETGGVIFSMWEGAKATFMPVPRPAFRDTDEKCAYFVQSALMALSPSDRPHWFHKPAGLPVWHLNLGRQQGQRGALSNFPVEWYWEVMCKSFPDGHFITVLRNPFDIAISRKQHTDWTFAAVLNDVVTYYEILAYGQEHFSKILFFEDLVADVEGSLRGICEACGVPFHEAMLKGAQKSQAPVEGRGPRRDHRDDWALFEDFELSADRRDLLLSTWEGLGRELAMPEGLKIA